MLRLLSTLAISLVLAACNSSAVRDAVDIGTGVPRKTIDTDSLGVNAFANDGRFGTPSSQYNEIASTLRLKFIRILANWDSLAQPSKATEANLAFLDSLIAAVPPGVDALIVMSGTPSWMSNPSNWTAGDPRKTYVEEWVRPIAVRYGNNPRVIGFEVWNEPNQNNQSNNLLGFSSNAALYVETLKSASAVLRQVAPSKLIVSAATTSINQNYPATLNYNRAMREAGAQSYADIWGMHFYGKQYENVIQPNGVKDFAKGLSLPIWITESGAQGFNNQLAYGEEVWPFLQDQISGIQRIYAYQFTEATPPETTYGLRNLSPSTQLSDLYVWLRDR